MSTRRIPQGEAAHQRMEGPAPASGGPPPGTLEDPSPGPSRAASAKRQSPAPSPRRPWSARRVTAAVTASLIALASGALLFEAVWTRTGNRANTWWTTLSNELAFGRLLAKLTDGPAE